MGLSGEDTPAKRGLSRLPRPGDRDHRVLPCDTNEDGGQIAPDQHARIVSGAYNPCNTLCRLDRQHSGIIDGFGKPYPEIRKVLRSCTSEMYSMAQGGEGGGSGQGG